MNNGGLEEILKKQNQYSQGIHDNKDNNNTQEKPVIPEIKVTTENKNENS